MKARRIENSLIKSGAALAAAGVLFASSCSSETLRATTAGLSAAADELEGDRDDISFGDWLLDELQDSDD